MRIEIADSTDVNRIIELVNDAYRGSSKTPGWTHETTLLAGRRIDATTLATMIEDSDSTILVMRHERDVVGCVALRRLDERDWYLSMLAVDPDRQEGGLGKAIMTGAESFARERGASRIKISVIDQRESLIAWYERRGYIRTGALERFPYDDP